MIAPLFLRAALAVTFIWAGLGKLIPTMPVDASQAAILATMGVHVPASPGPGAPTSVPASDVPVRPLPPPDADHGVPPTSSPDSAVAPTPAERAVQPLPQAPPPRAQAPAEPTAAPRQEPPVSEVRVRRLWGLALRIHAAAHPTIDASGKQGINLWPAVLGDGNWPRYFAIAVVIAELCGGILVALGFLTRLGACMLVGVMIGAIWLDQIGPAIQAANTRLLILPAHDLWDIGAWRPLLWQLSLLCSGCALALLGAGAPSLDRALGWMKRRGDDDDL